MSAMSSTVKPDSGRMTSADSPHNPTKIVNDSPIPFAGFSPLNKPQKVGASAFELKNSELSPPADVAPMSPPGPSEVEYSKQETPPPKSSTIIQPTTPAPGEASSASMDDDSISTITTEGESDMAEEYNPAGPSAKISAQIKKDGLIVKRPNLGAGNPQNQKPVKKAMSIVLRKDNTHISREKAVKGTIDRTKCVLRVFDVNGTCYEHFFTDMKAAYIDASWDDAKFISRLNKWRDQAIDRHFKHDPSNPQKKTRAKWSWIEREFILNIIKDKTFLTTSEWANIAGLHNQRFHGTFIEKGEKLFDGSKVAVSRQMIGNRSAAALASVFSTILRNRTKVDKSVSEQEESASTSEQSHNSDENANEASPAATEDAMALDVSVELNDEDEPSKPEEMLRSAKIARPVDIDDEESEASCKRVKLTENIHEKHLGNTTEKN